MSDIVIRQGTKHLNKGERKSIDKFKEAIDNVFPIASLDIETLEKDGEIIINFVITYKRFVYHRKQPATRHLYTSITNFLSTWRKLAMDELKWQAVYLSGLED